MMKRFDELVAQKKELTEWMDNSKKIDFSRGTEYSLRLDIKIGIFAYCGQAYSGSENYHHAPDFLLSDVVDTIRRMTSEIVDQSCGERLNSINTELAELKAKVIAELDKV